jgi:hypothetical protein
MSAGINRQREKSHAAFRTCSGLRGENGMTDPQKTAVDMVQPAFFQPSKLDNIGQFSLKFGQKCPKRAILIGGGYYPLANTHIDKNFLCLAAKTPTCGGQRRGLFPPHSHADQ